MDATLDMVDATFDTSLESLDREGLFERAVEAMKKATQFEEKAALSEERATLFEEKAALFEELYQQLLKAYKDLERGRTTHSERLTDGQRQLTLDLLGEILTPALEEEKEDDESIEITYKRKRGKRKPLPEDLPVVQSLVVPDEILEDGLENYEVIGTETSSTIERQAALVFVHKVVRPKLVRKNQDRSEDASRERELKGEASAEFIIAEPPTHPIPKAMVGVALLAQTIVMRWEDHLPLHRQQAIFKREGVALHKSTICNWHTAAAKHLHPLLEAMWTDARSSPILYTDATSVRMRAKKKCKRIHIWTVIAPEKYVLFAHSQKHNKEAVDQLLGDFSGYLVADAATVFDHVYEWGITECNCWAHARRYFHKALDSQPDEALPALRQINQLFAYEKRFKEMSIADKFRARQALSAPVVRDYFKWCVEQSSFEGTPLHAAIKYSLNQQEGLERFLEDARLPIHNNASELALRRQAIGRKNWMFIGNDRGATNNVTLVSLLASCALHGLNPTDYLRDIFCLLSDWSASSVLELAPHRWKATKERPDVALLLSRNPHWRAATLDVTKQFPELTDAE